MISLSAAPQAKEVATRIASPEGTALPSAVSGQRRIGVSAVFPGAVIDPIKARKASERHRSMTQTM
jgi:hypothetical protein